MGRPFTEDKCAETLNGGSVFPVIRSQSGLPASFLEKRDAIPGVCRGNLREQQSSISALTDEQAVYADFDFLDVPDALERRQDGDFKIHIRKLFVHQGKKPWISDGCCNCTLCCASMQRPGCVDTADAAGQLALFVIANEVSERLLKDSTGNLR
jgi:hypothetical protein